MAIDVYTEIRKIFSNYLKGIISAIDDRDSSEDSLRNLVGFNLSEKRGKATRDYGTSSYFGDTPLPVGMTAVYGLSAFRIPELAEEFIVVYGNVGGRPTFWIRKFRGPAMVSGSGTISNGVGLRAVVGVNTLFSKELTIGEFISGATSEAQQISILYTDPFSDAALSTVVAISPNLSGAPLFHLGSLTQDKWVELTESFIKVITPGGIIVTDLTGNGEYSRDPDGKFRRYRFVTLDDPLGNVRTYPDNVLAGWVVKNTVTQQIGSVSGNANRVSGGFVYVEFAVYESFSDAAGNNFWTEGDQIIFYRYPDTMKLGIPVIGGGGLTWYSDSVSQHRLSVGWQWNAPRKEIPMTIEYIKRDYFYDGAQPLLRNRIDQIYFGREIPDYVDTDEIGFSFDSRIGTTTPKFPDQDLRTSNWKDQANGTTNLWDRLNDATPNDADYIYSLVPRNTYRDLELRLEASTALPSVGRIRLTLRALRDFFFLPGPDKSKLSCTLSLGWSRTGTGTITSASSGVKIVGSGTLFTTELKVGDRISRDDSKETRTVRDIKDDTHLTVDAQFSSAFSGQNYHRIKTIGSVTTTPSLLQDYVLDVDVATVLAADSGFTGTPNLTVRFEVNNFDGKDNSSFNPIVPAQDVTYRITNVKMELETFTTANQLRLIFVPQYNGYMRGRPILRKSSWDKGAANPTFYARLKVQFAAMDKRLTEVFVFTDNGDATLTLDQFYSAWQFSLTSNEQNKRVFPFGIVNVWAYDNTKNTYFAQDASSTPDSPEAFLISRKTDQLISLSQFIGYGIVKNIPDIGTNWRYEARLSLGNQTIVAVDESDVQIRLCLFDADGIMNDHIFPNRSKDNASNPLKIFLSSEGELLGMLGQLGNLYAFKRSTIEIVNPSSTRSDIVQADVSAKKSIILSEIGIIYAGRFGMYLIPIHGGLIETLSDVIRDEYIAISDSEKEGMVATYCRDLGIIMFSMASVCYYFHEEMRVWWKRKFGYTPVAMTQRFDNSIIFAANSPALALLKYPDRTVYKDGPSGSEVSIPWVVETQWMTLEEDDIQKLVRTLESVTISNGAMSYTVAIYFDRTGNPTDALASVGTPFDITTISTVSGISENPLPVKLPNSFRECKIILRYNPALTAAQANYSMDILELKAFGETSVTGRED